jgi:puromycin-sensitive aminopeptidase
MAADLDPYRLPGSVTPRRYELELRPDLAAATFDGTVAVEVEVLEAVDAVVLNALELAIDEAWVDLPDGTRRSATVTYDEKAERATFALDGEVPAGPAVVGARFRGVLNDKLNGFYRSTFTDADGATRTIATTQMEATFARKAFPCWDEPSAKAVFAVTLVVPEDLTALSNGAEVSREPAGDGLVRVRFADTMPMSTYLVAFVVGPLEVTDPVDVDGVPLRIACPPGKTHLTPFALEVGAACLRYFTDYYGIAYPGGKLDMVAVPDFAFGAMENLGCITYREVLLLCDPAHTAQPDLMNLADVVNHEIAHMWFGDLVTMRWWNGLWLNEAFATFMEMKATEAFRPSWQRWVEFGLARTAAFDTDALDTTRPIEFPVVSPADAEGMFDVLTYEKGGAVLRMLEQYLGEDTFRDGIRRYLATHAYGNTETTDLWDAIEEASGQPVRRIMDSWIFQGGHPVVEVEQLDGGRIRLRQERFRLSAAVDPDGDAGAEGLGEVWAVPVVLKVGRGDDVRIERFLLETPEADVDLGERPDWVIVNAGGHGFYRARYVGERRERVLRALPHLDVLERYGIVDNAYAGVLAGSVTATEFLELCRGFGDEEDGAIWRRLAGALTDLERILDGEALDAFRATVRALVGPALRRAGFEPADGEDDRSRERRATLLKLAAVVGGDDEAIAAARRLRRAELAEPGSVDAALAVAAAITVAEVGDADDFEAGLARYRSPHNPQEEVRELYALAHFQDPALIDRLCEMTLGEIRSQNAPYLLRLALANRSQGARVWEFVRRNWDAINDRFPSNSIVRMVEGVTAITDEALAADVQGFFAEHGVPQGANQLRQILERQKANVALRQREAAALADALRA